MKNALLKFFVLIFCMFFCFSCLSTPEPEPEQITEQAEGTEIDIVTEETESIVLEENSEPVEDSKSTETEQITEQPEVIDDEITNVVKTLEISQSEDISETVANEENVKSDQLEQIEEITEPIVIVEPDQVIETEDVTQVEQNIEPIEIIDADQVIEEVEEIVQIEEEVQLKESEQNTQSKLIETTEPKPIVQTEEKKQQKENILTEKNEELKLLVQNNEKLQPEVNSVENYTQNEVVKSENEPIESVKIIPSRTVKMDIRQYLDIVYPGSGWIYLGEVSESNEIQKPYLLTYFGKRRNGEIDTSFTLRSSSAGKTIVHFYKQDALTLSFIDDYLEVIISDTIAPAGSRVSAPLYAEIVPPYQYEIPNPLDFVQQAEESSNIENKQESQEKQIDFENTKTDRLNQSVISPTQVVPSVGKTAVKETVPVIPAEEPRKIERKAELYIPDVPEVTITEEVSEESVIDESTEVILMNEETELSNDGVELLTAAQEAFYNQDYKTASELIDNFLKVANSQLDAGLYLKGQIYESKSDIQNIRTAISAYKQVVTDFPTSPFWQLAKNRQTYLNRFYFDIR